jgi:hypothetical protein
MSFVYRPRAHFEGFLGKVCGETKVKIPKEIIGRVVNRLEGRVDVKNVTAVDVDKALRYLAKTESRIFIDYYNHIYTIANIIRGSPLITLSQEEKEQFLRLFDIIEEERYVGLWHSSILHTCLDFFGYTKEQQSLLFGGSGKPGFTEDAVNGWRKKLQLQEEFSRLSIQQNENEMQQCE